MDLLDKVKEAGVIGAGGAGFPTHVKLQAKAEYILINGAECEPLLRVDQQLMEFHPADVIQGLKIGKEMTGAAHAIIGIKEHHKKVIEILKKTIKEMNLEGEIEVGLLPTVYPAGDEMVLVKELTGRIVPEGGIPIAVGCVVMNAESAYNVYHATLDRGDSSREQIFPGDSADRSQTSRENYAPEAVGGTRKKVCDAGRFQSASAGEGGSARLHRTVFPSGADR